MKANPQLTLLNWAGLLLLIGFAALILLNSAEMSLGYDDSYNASVAKNLAQGLGYASSYETVTPFDPMVTTGPTLLLPAALAIELFGNTFWAPTVATSIVVLLMFAVLLRVASRRMELPFGLLALCCIPPLTVATNVFDGWSRLRGDILAGELIVLATLLLPFGSVTADRRTARGIWLAGVIFGLAILTKLLAALCVAAIAVLFAAHMALQPERNYRVRRMLVVLAAGILLPLALLEITRFISLHGLAGYLDNLQSTVIANAKQESTLGKILLGQTDLSARLAKTFESAANWWSYVEMRRHPLTTALLWLGWMVMAIAGVRSASRVARWRLLALAIASGGLMFCFFTLFVVQFVGRVQLPAMVFAFAIGMATAEWAHKALTDSPPAAARSHRQRLIGLPLGLAAAFSVYWIVSYSTGARPEWQQQRANATAMSELVKSTREREPGATFCGLGWIVPRVLEYTLPGALWFRDCEGRVDELARAPDAATYLVLESAILVFGGRAAQMHDYESCQGKLVRKDEVFIMLRCSAEQPSPG